MKNKINVGDLIMLYNDMPINDPNRRLCYVVELLDKSVPVAQVCPVGEEPPTPVGSSVRRKDEICYFWMVEDILDWKVG